MTPISHGTLLAGRFRLEDLLEETGGAWFWRATDLTLNRDVAVHVLDEDDPRSQALLHAARTSATVTGPHLLRVLDAAVEDGVVYVVNEWGNGVSLDRMLLEGPLPPRQAAWMVREVAEAMTGAHRNGVAHGRLIPENVLLNDNGSVKLIGFVVDGVLHGGSGGTDPAVDVRNLGGLLYAALVGRWPGTAGSTLPAAPVAHGQVLRARQVRAGVPARLDRICDSILNGGDAQFPLRSAYEVKAALADFLGELGDGARLTGRRGAATTGVPTELGTFPLAADPEATQTAMPLFVDDPDEHQLGRRGSSQPDVANDLESPDLVGDPAVAGLVRGSSKTPYVGMGGGHMPDSWGPDAKRGQAQPPDDWDSDTARGTSWLRPGIVGAAVLVLMVGVVFAFNLGRGGEDARPPTDPQVTTTTPPPPPISLELAAVHDFDPFQEGGTPEENPDQVPAAYDGDVATAWQTSTYKDGPDITVYKPGVGLLIDLGSEEPVTDVHLRLVGSPTRVELLAAPPGSTEPTTTEGLDMVASDDNAGTSVTLTPVNDVTTRYLVIWLTALPRVSDGYRGGVAEIVVRS